MKRQAGWPGVSGEGEKLPFLIPARSPHQDPQATHKVPHFKNYKWNSQRTLGRPFGWGFLQHVAHLLPQIVVALCRHCVLNCFQLAAEWPSRNNGTYTCNLFMVGI